MKRDFQNNLDESITNIRMQGIEPVGIIIPKNLWKDKEIDLSTEICFGSLNSPYPNFCEGYLDNMVLKYASGEWKPAEDTIIIKPLMLDLILFENAERLIVFGQLHKDFLTSSFHTDLQKRFLISRALKYNALLFLDGKDKTIGDIIEVERRYLSTMN